MRDVARPYFSSVPEEGVVAMESRDFDGTRSVTLPGTETTDLPLLEPEPLYHVVLLDDDEHTYEYVIRMLCGLFGHTIHEAFAMAREVDTTGRVVVSTTHRERAELKREQIETFGPDPLIVHSRGSMRAVIEPIV